MPFKDNMKEEYNNFIKAMVTDSDFTPSGNRKNTSYEKLLQMVRYCVTRLNSNIYMSRKAF